MVVSLKTVDTNGSTWQERMAQHASEFDKPNKVLVDGQKPSVKILDIRVQPGGFSEAQSWADAVQSNFKDVQIVINEFRQ